MAASEVRVEFELPAFRQIRWAFKGECSQIGREIADKANAAAQEHDTGHRPEGPGSYNSRDFGNEGRPYSIVRVSDARGALDEALHGTLSEALYGVKGRQL